jgi:hypothetical protein
VALVEVGLEAGAEAGGGAEAGAALAALAAHLAAAPARAFGTRFGRVVLLRPRSLPRTTSGKLQRALAVQRLVDGALSGVLHDTDGAG